MVNKVCILLSGFPASGKTYFRNQLLGLVAAKQQEPLPIWTTISTDDIVEHHAKQRGETYAECWPNYIKEAERITFGQLKYAVDAGDDFIIIDRMNLSRKSRAKIVDLVKERDPSYKFVNLYFHCRTTEWDRRLKNRPGKEIPELVINRMVKSSQTPLFEEGFDYCENILTDEPYDIKKYRDFLLNIRGE